MISFVWSDPLPFYSGRGGTESLTIGHVRELGHRGIGAQILIYGLNKKDDRRYFPDVAFRNLKSLNELQSSDDTVVFLNIPHPIATKKRSFTFFHYPAIEQHGRKSDYKHNLGDSVVIANSRFLRSFWADYLDVEETSINVVYPFADPAFSRVKRTRSPKNITRVLYAGRLSTEKGIYTLLEALHHPIAAYASPAEQGFVFNITTAGNQTIHGKVLEKVLRSHPWINVTHAKHTPQEMAQLFAEHEIVIMPSNSKYWHEGFGMISVEAQHAGCRVVATNDGGLPETNCGELILFEPGNSLALYQAIQKAAKLGPLTKLGREEAVKHFTLKESVDLLLNVINKYS